MTQPSPTQLSTGITGLDQVIRAVLPGDNIVWHVDDVENYREFVGPYVRHARASGRGLVYFRFASHAPLLEPEDSLTVELDAAEGFESFVNQVHEVIRTTGRGAYYVFDMLSELAETWYSDSMLGNFFRLTCPYLLDMETVAYFGLRKNFHSFNATAPILNTAQIFFDVYRHRGQTYISPLKVQQRHSATMYMLHVRRGDVLEPVTQSTVTSEVRSSQPWSRLETPDENLGIWNATLRVAENLLERIGPEGVVPAEERAVLVRLIRLVISRDPRIAELVERHMPLYRVIEVARRTLGTGLIGGKAVGMLLARNILRGNDATWNTLLEPHDSFYIGSDVFYTFLVENGIWTARLGRGSLEELLADSRRARHRMLIGGFPEHVEKAFSDMLDYFGQYPFIVRSSSLLEDNFGNAFAGKYDSVFCVNQGSREKRLEDFKSAVRTIYASTMSERALTYRQQRGLLEKDEQMALLVQRVSGAFHGSLFFPQVAGVGFSYNPYVWDRDIEPEAGVLRLVFGLGTRAVDRRDDDYTRVVALNAPEKRPEAGEEARQFNQKRVDVLDLDANQLLTYDFGEIVQRDGSMPVELFASRDREMERRAAERGLSNINPWVLSFERLFGRTDFIARMRQMLRTIHDAYDYPVDVEFTGNFESEGDYRINLLQCRPLQVTGGGEIPAPPADLAPSEVPFRSEGAIIGPSRATRVDRLVYVVPEVYGELPLKDRYGLARLLGKLMHAPGFYEDKTIVLLGPGRWGTTTPSLGVPISFAEVDTVSVLCEIVAMRSDLIPDVSLGTHLFSDLVEMDILYMALFPDRPGNVLNREYFEAAPNALTKYLPDAEAYSSMLRVIETGTEPLYLNANALTQKAVCYRR